MIRIYCFVFIYLLFSQSTHAGLYEGINFFEQQKYEEAWAELYPLTNTNLYAHPYILDLHLHKKYPLSQDEVKLLYETKTLITKSNLDASKAYIKIQNKSASRTKKILKKK